MPIAAECGACHKRFKAPDKLAGKRVKCPQCGGVIQVPAPQAPKVEKPAAASLLDEEQVPKSAAPVAAAAAAPAQAAGQCPSCGAALVAKAVLCVSCGHDLRTGQKVEAKPPPIPTTAGPQVTLGKKDWDQEEKKKKTKKKKRKKRRGDLPQGIAFLRGLAVSFGSGMVGAFMWLGLYYLFGIGGEEMPIIAWVLGGLAGVGMMIGYGHEDVLAGLGAAAMALLAVYAAQVMMAAATIADPAHFVKVYTGQDMDELAAEFGEGFPDEGMPQGDEGYDEEGMPEGEEVVDEEGASEGEEGLTEEEMAALQEIEDLDLSEVEVGFVGIIVGGIVVGTIGMVGMFLSLFGLLSLGLSFATAYQVGTGGSWLEGD